MVKRLGYAALLASFAVGACHRKALDDETTGDAGVLPTGSGGAVGATGSAGATDTGGATTIGTGGAAGGGAAATTGTAGTGGARTLSFLPATSYTSDRTYAVALGDLDGDGTVDIAAAADRMNLGPPASNLLINDGHAHFSVPTGFSSAFRSIALGDFNQDGHLDIAGASSIVPSVLFNNGDATFGNTLGISTSTRSALSVAVADLNGDGRVDLMTVGGAVDAGALDVSLAGPGGQPFVKAGSYPVGGGLYAIATGDLDGDGDVDVIVAGARNNLNIFLNRGDATFAPAVVYPFSIATLALGDLNGDGKLDIAALMSEGLVTIRGNGDGSFGDPITFDPGPYTGLAIGDLDGDGHLDLIAANAGTMDILVYTHPGGATAVFSGGKIVLSLAIGDLDADGKPDIIVAGATGVSVLLNDGR